MVRRYQEPIEVRAGDGGLDRHDAAGRAPSEGSAGSDPDPAPSPTAFLWRGRLYVVRDVIGHWRERKAWWREALDPDENAAAQGLDYLEQEVWRVEASAGRLAGTGVYDLGKDGGLGMDGPARGWRLLRVAD